MNTPRPVTLGLQPSFGFGDRTGLATPGHVEAMKRAGSGIQPIYPQQSIREMTRTQRTPQQVMDDALQGMVAAGWTGVTGADADHLKTNEDVDRTAAVGFTFFTIDPSGEVDQKADSYSADELAAKFKQVEEEIDWFSKYEGKEVKLPSGTVINLDTQACRRCAVKYGRAINMAVALAQHIKQVNEKLGRDYEIELSVDETDQPTTLAEHYIVADQCVSRGMKLVSLAPRYIGEFEKGVDYKGDRQSFGKSLNDHAAIAQMIGPYKLSLHSGSDKLSIYPLFAKLTRGMFHVKTAGTSYLEALRVVARHDEKLFRRIVDFSRSRYETDKATYHVSARLDTTPPPSDVPDIKVLETIYLGTWWQTPAGTGLSNPGRQIVHTTFGSVLTDPTLKSEVFGVLKSHPDTYKEILAEHFEKHLAALKSGL